jgi:alkylhydroperoxidase family enzyme
VKTRYDDSIAALRSAACPIPPELQAYTDKVRDDPRSFGDDDVAALEKLGLSEDEIFDYTVAVSVAAGLERLDLALQTMR